MTKSRAVACQLASWSSWVCPPGLGIGRDCKLVWALRFWFVEHCTILHCWTVCPFVMLRLFHLSSSKVSHIHGWRNNVFAGVVRSLAGRIMVTIACNSWSSFFVSANSCKGLLVSDMWQWEFRVVELCWNWLRVVARLLCWRSVQFLPALSHCKTLHPVLAPGFDLQRGSAAVKENGATTSHSDRKSHMKELQESQRLKVSVQDWELFLAFSSRY